MMVVSSMTLQTLPNIFIETHAVANFHMLCGLLLSVFAFLSQTETYG